MPKRLVPSCGRSTRPSRRSRLISPPSGSSKCAALISSADCAEALFREPSHKKSSILDNHIDTSVYTLAQLLWFQLHDTQRFNACFDFARCDDKTLASLFPSKFGGRNRIPASHRHTAKTIRIFQELRNSQQLHLIDEQTIYLPPLVPILKKSPCIGIRIQYLVQNVSVENRVDNIQYGYVHLIREAIRTRADNIRDELFPDYYMGVQGIIISNKEVRLVLYEVDKETYSDVIG